jgi:hypothetical protein
VTIYFTGGGQTNPPRCYRVRNGPAPAMADTTHLPGGRPTAFGADRPFIEARGRPQVFSLLRTSKGATWTTLMNAGLTEPVIALAVDTGSFSTVYAASVDSGVFACFFKAPKSALQRIMHTTAYCSHPPPNAL